MCENSVWILVYPVHSTIFPGSPHFPTFLLVESLHNLPSNPKASAVESSHGWECRGPISHRQQGLVLGQN